MDGRRAGGKHSRDRIDGALLQDRRIKIGRCGQQLDFFGECGCLCVEFPCPARNTALDQVDGVGFRRRDTCMVRCRFTFDSQMARMMFELGMRKDVLVGQRLHQLVRLGRRQRWCGLLEEHREAPLL